MIDLKNNAALRFDEKESQILHWLAAQQPWLAAELEQLCAINSGSYHIAGLKRMAERLEPLFAPLQAEHCRHALLPVRSLNRQAEFDEKPLGEVLSWRKRPEAPIQVLLVGHYDTVFAADSAFQTPRLLDANTLNGPGAADLKGGLLVMTMALQALEQHPQAERIGWEVLLNPDEEIGSPGSAPLLAAAAARHHLGLCYEPSLPSGDLVSARKGSGNFSVQIGGRAAHAGRDHALGRNAIAAMAKLITALDALNGQHGDMTVNVGAIEGGGSVNVVPDRCLLRLNVRVSSSEQAAAFEQALRNAASEIDAQEGYQVTTYGGFHRPPKLMTPGLELLLAHLRACGQALGLDLRWQATGGCCDGNNLAAAGLVNVDNLGVRGAHIHSDQELCLLDSLSERAKLSAALLFALANGSIDSSALRPSAT